MSDESHLRICVFANPNAGGISDLGSAVAEMVNMQHDVSVVFTKSDAHLAEQIKALGSNSADVIAIAGGDGTISRAAQVLIECGLPLLVLPLGTANDFARSLDIPKNIVDAVRLVSSGQQTMVDVGYVVAGENQSKKRTFLNAVGLGLSARVSEAQDDRMKGALGGLSYAITTLQNVGSLEAFDAEIELDGVVQAVSASQITLGNGVFFGGGLRVSNEASLQSGFLHGYLIGDISPAELIALGPRVKLGNLDDHHAITKIAGKEITIRCKPEQPVNVDGDIFGETPMKLSIMQDRLKVYSVLRKKI